jgi:hypothetical protein
MDSRLHRVLQLTIAATLALTTSLSSVAHAIPKAAEDENGTVSIAPDVPRPKASAKAPKPTPKQSARKTSKGSKQASAKSAGKTPSKKTARGKK